MMPKKVNRKRAKAVVEAHAKEVDYHISRPDICCVIKVEGFNFDDITFGVGFARWNPEDKRKLDKMLGCYDEVSASEYVEELSRIGWDEQKGKTIAYGRALLDAAKKLGIYKNGR